MEKKYPIESDARQAPPSFNELVEMIKKLFVDYLEDVMKSPPHEIAKAWERYKTLNHLYQPPADAETGKEDDWRTFTTEQQQVIDLSIPQPVKEVKPKYYSDQELRDIISMVCDQLNEGFNGREEFIDQTIAVFAGKKAAIEELRKQGVKHPNPHLCDNRQNCGYPGCECLPF